MAAQDEPRKQLAFVVSVFFSDYGFRCFSRTSRRPMPRDRTRRVAGLCTRVACAPRKFEF